MERLNTRLYFILYLQLLPGAGLESLSPWPLGQQLFRNVTAQRKHVPRKTRGTRLRIGCLILSCKVFLNELSPRQHLVETLRVGMDLHIRQILKKELDIISGCKVVCLCCFYHTVLNFGSAGISLNSQFFLPAEKERILFSARLLEMSQRGSFR